MTENKDDFTDEILLVIANKHTSRTLFSTAVRGYYFEVYQRWELWVPIGLLTLCCLASGNTFLCLVCYRKKKQKALKIHSIGDMEEF
jgi:hypothetical protein